MTTTGPSTTGQQYAMIVTPQPLRVNTSQPLRLRINMEISVQYILQRQRNQAILDETLGITTSTVATAWISTSVSCFPCVSGQPCENSAKSNKVQQKFARLQNNATCMQLQLMQSSTRMHACHAREAYR